MTLEIFKKSSLAELIGREGTLRRACERAEMAANSDAPVFLLGEPGVGKETLARAIADATQTRFFSLRASLISEERWNALLDGPDVFQGATLYIAETEFIPRKLGRKLATALREGALELRVIFGTTKPYPELSAAPSFAPELLSFFAAFPIALPPLRERGDETSELAEFFFMAAAERFGVWRDPLTPDELESLKSVEYPENLDTLRRLVAEIVRRDLFPNEPDEFADFAEVDLFEIPPPPELAPPPDATRTSDHDASSPDSPERFPTLDETSKAHIERALRLSHGVVEGKSGAATLLDINPYTLRARMRKLGIDWTLFRD